MCPRDNALVKVSTAMSDNKSPTHRVFTLIPRKGSDGKDDNFWLNIGSAFEHGDQKGYNLILEALPLDGKLVLREVKEEQESEPEPPRKTRR